MTTTFDIAKASADYIQRVKYFGFGPAIKGLPMNSPRDKDCNLLTTDQIDSLALADPKVAKWRDDQIKAIIL